MSPSGRKATLADWRGRATQNQGCKGRSPARRDNVTRICTATGLPERGDLAESHRKLIKVSMPFQTRDPEISGFRITPEGHVR